MSKAALRQTFLFFATLVALFILPVNYLTRAKPPAPTDEPRELVKLYLKAVYARDYRTAYKWISQADRENKSEADYLRENPSLSGIALELTRRLAEKVEFKDIQLESRQDRATVRFTVRVPNANAKPLQDLFLNFDPDRLAILPEARKREIEHRLAAMQSQGNLPWIEGADNVEVVKEAGQWRIFANWAAAVRVSFRAAVKDGLPWKFWAVQETILAKPGETLQAVYKAKNLSDKPIRAKARHLEEPKDLAKRYLDIVQCFCLIQQTLQPGEEKELPVIFRVQGNAPDTVKEFRVAYEFYPIEKFPRR